MTSIPSLPEHPPIRCMLEMRYDGHITITRQPGCTPTDVYDILRLLTQSGGPFDHLTILPSPSPVRARARRQACCNVYGRNDGNRFGLKQT
jgi:hypothetical protein